MTQAQEQPDAALVRGASAEETTSTTCEPCLLLAAAATSAQSYAMLAVPSHLQSAPGERIESDDDHQGDRIRDPIAEAGWLAAVDALLMGGLLGEW